MWLLISIVSTLWRTLYIKNKYMIHEQKLFENAFNTDEASYTNSDYFINNQKIIRKGVE